MAKSQGPRSGRHPHVAWRFRQPGSRRHRRARCRRGHPRARGRHRRDRQPHEKDSDRLAEAPPEQFVALHFHHRVPRPKGQPERHPGLGRPDQSRASRSSPPTRRHPAALAGTIWRPGPTGSKSAAGEQQAQALRRRRSSRTRPCSIPAPAARPTRLPERGIGDVLLAWENEAFLALDELGADKFEIVVPSLSILAEPPVALVDGNVDHNGTRKVAQAYLEFLYSPAARPSSPSTTIARSSPMRRRPRHCPLSEDHSSSPIDQFSAAGTRPSAKHFADGGIFDVILQVESMMMHRRMTARTTAGAALAVSRDPAPFRDSRWRSDIAHLSRPDRADSAWRRSSCARPRSG